MENKNEASDQSVSQPASQFARQTLHGMAWHGINRVFLHIIVLSAFHCAFHRKNVCNFWFIHWIFASKHKENEYKTQMNTAQSTWGWSIQLNLLPWTNSKQSTNGSHINEFRARYFGVTFALFWQIYMQHLGITVCFGNIILILILISQLWLTIKSI